MHIVYILFEFSCFFCRIHDPYLAIEKNFLNLFQFGVKGGLNYSFQPALPKGSHKKISSTSGPTT